MSVPNRKWTDDETQFLIANAASKTAMELSDELGRSTKSIQRKAENLHLSIWRDDQFGDGLRDIGGKVQIGNRQLLAKTCPKCGRFLMARRFFQRNNGNRAGHWYTNCRACTNTIANKARPDRDRKSSTERNQRSSKRNAINTGRPWTADDDAVVRDTENYPTAMMAATVLGRTYRAVITRGHELGVHRANFADVGMRWTIRFGHHQAHGIKT